MKIGRDWILTALLLFCLLFTFNSSRAAETPILRIAPGGHTAEVRAVAFTPDGRRLISAGKDKVVRVWDLQTGEQRALRYEIGPGVEGESLAEAVCPDKNTPHVAFGTGGKHSDILLFDYLSGRQLARLKGHQADVMGLAFSPPDGRQLASCGWDGKVILWDAQTDKPLHTWSSGEGVHFTSIAWSPDGQTLAAGSWRRLDNGGVEGAVRMWNVQTGKELRPLKCDREVMCVTWSSDGTLAYGSRDDAVHLFNPRKDSEERRWPARQDTVLSLAFTPDGKELIGGGGEAGNDTAVHVWSAADGSEIRSFKQHPVTVFAVALSPNGDLAASGDALGAIYVWDPSSCEIKSRLKSMGESAFTVAWSPDGHRVGWSKDYNSTTLENGFDFERVEPVQLGADAAGYIYPQTQRNGLSLVITPDRNTVVIRDASGAEKQVIESTTDHTKHIRCVTWTPDGKVVVGTNLYLTLWDVSGKPREECLFEGHEGPILAVAVSKDGRYLASTSTDQTIRIWSLDSKAQPVVTPLLSLFQGSEWVAWTPEGYYAASPAGDDLIVWHLNQGPDQAATVVHATQFRNRFYHPEVIRHLLASGSLTTAVATAAQHRRVEGVSVGVPAPAIPAQVEAIADAIPKLPALEVVQVGDAMPQPDGSYTTSKPAVNLQVRLSNAAPADVTWRMTVNARVISDQGVRRLEVVHNGDPNVKELAANLQPGMVNRISLVAVNKEGLESSPLNIDVDCQAAAPPSHPTKLYLLAIGISKFADPAVPELTYTANDAQAISDFYRSQSGKLFSQVEVHTLTDQEATGARILEELDRLNKQAGQDDLAMVFVASHGYEDPASDTFYLVPSDASMDPNRYKTTLIPWNTILDKLQNLPTDLVLMIDTCHAAGAGLGVEARFDAANGMQRAARHSVLTLAACMPSQESWEDSAWKHGAFTYELLQALQGKAQTKNGMVSLWSAYEYLLDEVPSLVGKDRRQTPKLYIPLAVEDTVPRSLMISKAN